ncbi:MAG: hypothetical protein O8C64_07485 [Candidatus Methanoperedens sp.]|nr:hypothetical protein [Candidatus Methanoperedens sp.]MCZ7405744.1 hypothetical protein [Candidatus Methanoperedens sp.]
MNSKIILLSFAVIAVGLFALPSTLSLFSGQHTFYNGSQVQCSKCHQDIYNEFATADAKMPHKDKANCGGCHRTTTGTGANISNNSWKLTSSSTGVTGTVVFKAHSAVTVECLACHGRVTDTVGNYATKGKEWGVATQLLSDQEAHRAFYWGSVSDKAVGDINQSSIGIAETGTPFVWWTKANQSVVQLKGGNTACIGCHTHTVVNVTWDRSIGYGMVVTTEDTKGLNITSWSINSTRTLTYSSGQ